MVSLHHKLGRKAEYLRAYETVSAARSGIGRYLESTVGVRTERLTAIAGCALLHQSVRAGTGGVDGRPAYPSRRTLLPCSEGCRG